MFGRQEGKKLISSFFALDVFAVQDERQLSQNGSEITLDRVSKAKRYQQHHSEIHKRQAQPAHSDSFPYHHFLLIRNSVHTHIYTPRLVETLRNRTSNPRIHTSQGNEFLAILPTEHKGGRPIGSQYWSRSERLSFMDRHRIDIS